MNMTGRFRRKLRRLAVHAARPFGLLLILISLVGMRTDSTAERVAIHGQSLRDLSRAFMSGPVNWQPCPENSELDCGTLNLPVDYQQPHQERFDMAVIRARALHVSKRIGVLFTHPGANESGVDAILTIVDAPAFDRLRERFDIVSLDPRGAGRTRPLDCDLNLPDVPDDPGDAALIAFFDDYGLRVSEQCLDQDRDFVLSINANNFARDIEMLRRALGENQLSFGMISNSGPVAAVYASLFPKRVRAMIIDSTVAPEFRDYLIERWSEELASYSLTLWRVDQICRHDTTCPLRETGVTDAFDKVFDRLLTQPVTAPNGMPFTARDLSSIFFSSLLPVEQNWPRIAEALSQAVAGDFTLLFQLQPPPRKSDDSMIARFCNDYGTRRTAAEYLPLVTAVADAYPRFISRFMLANFAASCSAWPGADPPIVHHVQRRLEVPILLIGSAFDPAAPLSWTKRMAQTLGMDQHVVAYQGGGHALALRSDLSCISDVIDAYLFDLRLPSEGYTCPPATP